MPHLVGSVLAGAALVVLPVTPAQAAPAETSLRLTVTYPGEEVSGTRGVELICNPARGAHPRADTACRDLDLSRGQVERDAGDAICTMIYAPVVAEAQGTWRGRTVQFKQEYGNDCQMHAHTGTIFRF
ncbi:SSI family serine proteinase inhibitor [Spirillospora sp. CA-294931]|uniref:SSI family serine proteinase inhibitor n=1 Tax=Spirillospora sp. CA-294931 TaxID=3240042 RepID=UPI003D92C102